jgi:hypothetical protein
MYQALGEMDVEEMDVAGCDYQKEAKDDDPYQ